MHRAESDHTRTDLAFFSLSTTSVVPEGAMRAARGDMQSVCKPIMPMNNNDQQGKTFKKYNG